MVWTSHFTLYTSDSAEGRSCQTNPIPPAGKKRQVLGGKGVMVNRTAYRAWQNKANFPAGPGEPGPGDVGRAANAQNEPNLRSQGRPDGPGARHRMPATPVMHPLPPSVVAFDKRSRLGLSYRVDAAEGRPGKVQRLRKRGHETSPDRRG